MPTPAEMVPSTARTPSRIPPPLLHHFWAAPYDQVGSTTVYRNSDPMYAIPGFLPMARCRVDTPDNPPGYSNYATNATGVGVGLANWVEWLTQRRNAAGQPYEQYTFFAQNWGELAAHGGDLCRNPADAVTGSGTATEFEVHTPYNANGIASVNAYTGTLLDSFSAQLASRNLCQPSHIHWDWERRILNFNFLPSPDRSWNAILADPRYSTELVDGVRTWQQFVNAATTSSGAAVSVTPASGAFTTTNANWFTWSGNALFQIMEYALDQALYGIARAKFPAITTYGCYIFIPSRPDLLWNIPAKAYMPPTSGIVNEPTTTNTMQPELYPLDDVLFDASGTSRFQDWFPRYGLTRTGNDVEDLRALWRAAKRNQCLELATRYPGRELVPWMPFPGMSQTYTNVNGATLTLTIDDIRDLAIFLVQTCNVRQFVWWQNPVFLPNLDGYRSLLLELNSLAGASGPATLVAHVPPIRNLNTRVAPVRTPQRQPRRRTP